ncbi:UNVERIFIED_CONTAM: hypothetical protein RMT77_013228 [Armadillidium vulgare]
MRKHILCFLNNIHSLILMWLFITNNIKCKSSNLNTETEVYNPNTSIFFSVNIFCVSQLCDDYVSLNVFVNETEGRFSGRLNDSFKKVFYEKRLNNEEKQLPKCLSTLHSSSDDERQFNVKKNLNFKRCSENSYLFLKNQTEKIQNGKLFNAEYIVKEKASQKSITESSNKEERKFILGYLTGSNRRPDDRQYMRPGLQISGAITLAVDEINSHRPLAFDYKLDFVVAETFGQELESIRETTQLRDCNISAYIGPQETCVHEARFAAAFNLPMLSYFCTHSKTSNKNLFPTFARTRPPDNQISKSVASVLKRFNWRKVIFLYNNSPDEDFTPVAKTIRETLKNHNITVIKTRVWNSTYFHAFMDNIFDAILRETHKDCRSKRNSFFLLIFLTGI